VWRQGLAWYYCFHQLISHRFSGEHLGSVPDLDPPDPHVFGPSGSGFFYHQAKLVKKTLILTVLRLLYDFLSLKNDINVASKNKNQKNLGEKIFLPDPDPLVRGTAPRIRIRTNMSRIHNTGWK
jgi:hypothetical protein